VITTRDVLQTHAEVDGHLADLESRARSASRRTHWGTMRVLNDHAYFMLVFGRFEQHINQQCDNLITRKTASPQWRRRRLRDGIDDLERYGFMRKVNLLLDRGRAESGRIRNIYQDIRCVIAHGGSNTLGPIVLPTLAAELRTLSGLLRAQ
jgi:hypothetical protein